MQPLLQARNVTNATFWDSGVQELSDEAMSWIGGTLCVGGLFGTPLYGYCANAMGRKKTLIMSAIPFLVSYCLIIIADSDVYLYAARIVAGLGGAGALVIVPMYVGETAEDSVRGVLSSYLNLFICVGILTSYIIGSYTSYMVLALFSLACTIVFLILAMWLPESPVYSLANDRPDEAFRALVKLRGNHRELIQQQINTISTSVKEMTSDTSGSVSIKDLILEPSTRKALIIVLTGMTVQQASGISPIINYTVAIFEASGSQLSPTIAAIIVGALQIVGALFGTVLMDRAGRKFLLMLSSIGMTLTLSPIAYFLYLKSHGAEESLLISIGWLPVTSMAIFIIVYALGFGPVPFVLLSELFNAKSKSVATSICVAHVWIVAFLFLKFFSTVSDLLGIETCFMFFALCCAGGAVFTFFYVIETKGKPLEQILEELGGPPPPGSRASPVPFLDRCGDNFTLKAKDQA